MGSNGRRVTTAAARALAGLALAGLALALGACGGSRSARGNDVVVTASGPADPVATGATVAFTMTVQNLGPEAAHDLKLSDSLGNFLSAPTITCSASGGAACPETPDFVMTLPALPVGGQLVFQVSATVNATNSVTVTNTMTAAGEDDVDRLNNTATGTADVTATNADLEVTGIAPATVVPGGSTAEFVMTVSNLGPDAATNVKLTEQVGGNLTLTGITCDASGGATCPTAGVVMTLDTLPAQGVLTFHVQATVQAGTDGAILNTLTASADNDRSRDNNSVVAVGNATANNVHVSATGPGVPVSGGATTTVTMVVANDGPGDATDVDLANTPGANLSLGGAIACTAAGGAVCPATTGASMRAPKLPVNATLTFKIPLTVAAGANGTLVDTFSATAAGDARPGDNSASATVSAVSADLGVSQEAAASVAAGSAAVFKVLVANPGPGTANNLAVHWKATAPFAVAGVTVTCASTGGAVCPATPAADMTGLTLGVSRSLVFTFTVPVPASGRGDLTSKVSIAADGDPNAANNTSTATTKAVDARNGLYRAYAADGRSYDLTVDFDARSYTMAGNGGSAVYAFTPDGAGNYVVNGNQRFRVAQDLIVGGHAFAAGLVPYVAARSFATSVSAAAGAYNLMTLDVGADGSAPSTHPGTARLSGNVLQVCQDDFAVLQTAACGIGSLKSYSVSVSGDVYTAVDLATGAGFSFRVARSGAASFLLSTGGSTGADTTQLQWRIGLPESAGLVGGTVYGPGFNGWLAAPTADSLKIVIDGASASYAVLGSSLNATAGLFRLDAQSPVAMLQGTLSAVTPAAADGGTVWVMQAYPLVVVGGDALAAPGAPSLSGLLQIGVP